MCRLTYEVLEKCNIQKRLKLRTTIISNDGKNPALLYTKASFLIAIFSKYTINQDTFKLMCKLCKIPQKRTDFWYVYQADNFIDKVELVEDSTPSFCDYYVYFKDEIYMIHINELDFWDEFIHPNYPLIVDKNYIDKLPHFNGKFQEVELSYFSSTKQILKLSNDNSKLILGCTDRELRVLDAKKFYLI